MHALILMYQVSSELQLHADRSPGLLVSIVEARRRLAGMETSDLLRCVCACVCVFGAYRNIDQYHTLSHSMPHNDLLEGAIVLEEFTKVGW